VIIFRKIIVKAEKETLNLNLINSLVK